MDSGTRCRDEEIWIAHKQQVRLGAVVTDEGPIPTATDNITFKTMSVNHDRLEFLMGKEICDMVARNVALKEEEWYKDMTSCLWSKSVLITRATKEKVIRQSEEPMTNVIHKLVFGSTAYVLFIPMENVDEGETESVRTHFIRQFQGKTGERSGFSKFSIISYANAESKQHFTFKTAITAIKKAIIESPTYCVSALYRPNIDRVNSCNQRVDIRIPPPANPYLKGEGFNTGTSGTHCNDSKGNGTEISVPGCSGESEEFFYHTFPQGIQLESKILQPLITESQDALGVERRYYDPIGPGAKTINILAFGPKSYAKMCFINLIANFTRNPDSNNLVFVEGSSSQLNDFTSFSFATRIDRQMAVISIINSPALEDTDAIGRTTVLKTFITEIAQRKFPLHAVALVVPAQLQELQSSVQEIFDLLSNVFSPNVDGHIMTLVACPELYYELSSPVMTANCLRRIIRKQCFKFLDTDIPKLSSGGYTKDLAQRYWKIGKKVWTAITKFLIETTPLRVNGIWSSFRKMYSLHAQEESIRELELKITSFMEICRLPSSEGLQYGRQDVWNSTQAHFRILEVMEPTSFHDVCSLLQTVVKNMEDYSDEDKRRCICNLIAGRPVQLHKVANEMISHLHQNISNFYHVFQKTMAQITSQEEGNKDHPLERYTEVFRKFTLSVEKSMYLSTFHGLASLLESVQVGKQESVLDVSCPSVSMTEFLHILKEEIKPEHEYHVNNMIQYLEKNN